MENKTNESLDNVDTLTDTDDDQPITKKMRDPVHDTVDTVDLT